MKRDPWRYVCPDCGSHNIKKNSQDMPVDKTMRVGVVEYEYAEPYRCRYCQTGLQNVLDKKTDTLVQP